MGQGPLWTQHVKQTHALGMSLLKGSVYLITHMPSDPQAGDIYE